MKYVATALSLTLGAWRIRLSLDIEDAPDDRTFVLQNVHRMHRREPARERAEQ